MSWSNRAVLGDISSSNNASSNTKINGKTIEQMYQKKTQLEHILLRPDTYSKYTINFVLRIRKNFDPLVWLFTFYFIFILFL
jgi:hypothetical protein